MDLQYKPYVATDIETTGIGLDCEVLEIACVVDDFQAPINELSKFDEYIGYKSFHAEPMAMVLNAKLIAEMASDLRKEYPVKFAKPEEVIRKYLYFLENEMNKYGGDKLVMAGKNPQGFDKPRLDQFISKYGGANDIKNWNSMWKHRALDIGSLYFPDFGTNVALSDINQTIGRVEVTHNGLEDSFDIVYAVRKKMGVPCV